jgi:hypothetical protein
MGYNNDGSLGDGTYSNAYSPELIVASGVTAVAAGWQHSLFLKSDGSLWAMGGNYEGQLGDGADSFFTTNQPEQIVASNVTAIAAGGHYSLFLKGDGSLWAMGDDGFGQLGDGAYSQTNRPEQVVPVWITPPGYNQISTQFLSGGSMRFSFLGAAGANYALDRSSSLMPANWTPLATNPAGAGGVLLFTNTPNKATNNFWRIRSVL